MIEWLLFILLPGMLGALMLFASLRIRKKRLKSIILATLIAIMILTLYFLLVFTRYNAPDVRFNQFVVGGVIGLFFMMISLHWFSKSE